MGWLHRQWSYIYPGCLALAALTSIAQRWQLDAHLRRGSGHCWVGSHGVALCARVRAFVVCKLSAILNWGVLRQKQVSRTGTSNYIPQYPWDVINCLCLWYLLLKNQMNSFITPFYQHLHNTLIDLVYFLETDIVIKDVFQVRKAYSIWNMTVNLQCKTWASVYPFRYRFHIYSAA